jgi:NAD(P)-dependent dehydrogenase (short-subunit alcohol dehydrogenase family)
VSALTDFEQNVTDWWQWLHQHRHDAKGMYPNQMETQELINNQPFNSPAGEFHLNKDNIPCILQRELPEAYEIAPSVAFLLGDDSAYVTKSSWAIDGGWFEGNYSSG